MRKSIGKRILAVAMTLVTAASMTACGGDKKTSSGVDGDTIKIGVVCPISGNSAIAGKYITHGVEVAEDELG